MEGERVPLRILFVEDNPDDVELVRLELRRSGLDVVYARVETPEALREALEESRWDLVLSDFSMPRFSGPEALAMVQESGLDIPFIIISGAIGEEFAVESLKAGAEDFLVKSRLHRLVPAIERGLREAEERRSRRRVEESLRENEQMLVQSQKMEAIGRLAGGVAHDFNNLLTVIRGHAEMLLGEIPEPGHEDLLEIVRAAERGATLTRQLLSFGRRQTEEARVVRVRDVVDDTRRMIERLLMENIEIVVTHSADSGWVRVDPGQIEQVLMNLGVNAGDAMPEGGRLEIETGMVGDAVFLRVTDTGIGMTPEVRDRAFEPFFTTKVEGRGTGLGLAIVYGIVQQNHGEITVETSPEAGTTFRIVLPAVEPDEAATEEPPTPRPVASRTATVLVVEDEHGVRSLTCRVLAGHGYTVLDAESGIDALQVAIQHAGALDLLLTDVVLPGMSGSELARRIHETRPHVAILFMSGHHDDPSVRRRIMAQEAGFLPKPFTSRQLLES
ncbi:MAG TPA: response regulator, partial [Gemmatimonadota bacterium]|nr:response regulator [Gemmatimonadota bacterium]